MGAEGRPNLEGFRKPRGAVLRDAHLEELPHVAKHRRGADAGEPIGREPLSRAGVPTVRAQGREAATDNGSVRPVPRAELRAARAGHGRRDA